ncbi:LuxR C-terminal-related transcriptional regulator [Mycobacterium sp. 155]|uniref:LuxR C-terminal-related transcriptional regulator n=1 Tax=Mycobacterium sp. 155 TaxID=1157943 RepID=UPI0012FC15EF|nr:LuxR C-terminal-related transcriptional regulator [Mycobacterium sp. 155]
MSWPKFVRAELNFPFMQYTGGTPTLGPVPWFLATPPAPNPEMVDRPAIAATLTKHVTTHRATVVTAPSGFGKTVSVTQWATARREEVPGSVSWLTLTDRVADSGDLLRGVITALQEAAHDRGDAAMHRRLTAAFDSVSATTTIAAIAPSESPDPITVVIDDFQHSRYAADGADFANFVEHAPPWLRLILITTGALDPALTRLMMHGHLAQIGREELAMTADDIIEAAANLDRPVSPDQAEAILTTTAGWPAAVRLMLVSRLETQLLSSESDMTDYIRSVVLRRMRPELGDFVLSTTVSTRLDDHLARVLSERTHVADLISECTGSGLFIERFGSGEGAVYRWHSMFARHCQAILQNNDPDRWLRLNALAADALAQSYPLQAVDHAIRAEAAGLAVGIITDHWLELLLQSRTETLDRACTEVAGAFGEKPELLMIRACCRDLAGDTLTAKLLLGRAGAHNLDETASRRMAFIADISQVLISADHDTMVAAAERAEAALVDRTIAPPTVYACALFVLGWAHSRLRHGSQGTVLLESAIHECRAQGLHELVERSRTSLAFAMVGGGEFDRAMRFLNDGGQNTHHDSDSDSDSDSDPHLWLSHDGGGIEQFTEGFVRFWRGDLEPARDDFLAMDQTIGSGYPDVGRMMLALTVATLGDHKLIDIAGDAVDRIPDADSHGVPWTSYKLTSRARLAEMRGARAEALAMTTQLEGRKYLPMMFAIASGICRRLGDTPLARRLAGVATDSEAQPYSRSYGHLVLALLDWESGRGVQAHHNLEKCLTAAAPEQVRYPFIDHADPACLELLSSHASETAYGTFLDECVTLCERAAVRQTPPPERSLTVREREVLAFLRTPLTADDIAARLGVSVNTIKTHQRAIYRKLGVANRREAVQIART